MVEPVIEEEFINSGVVYFEFRDYAFLGQPSFLAAEAARCANDQDKFWEFHDMIFANQGQATPDRPTLDGFAIEVGLDMNEFGSCMDTGKHQQAVQDSIAGGKELGVTGTPALVLNGELVENLQNYQQLMDMIVDTANQQ